MQAIRYIRSFANRIKMSFFKFKVPGKIRNKYPLYWLAPVVNQRTRRISVYSLLNDTSKCRDSKIINYPLRPGIINYLLSLIGLDPSKKKPVHICIARLEDKFFVEKGLLRLRLAVLLNLNYVAVRFIEYDYTSLRKLMHIHRRQDIDIAGVARKNGSGFDYYGISPAHLEVLTRYHRVPFLDNAATPTQESVTGIEDGFCNRAQERQQKQKNLYIISNKINGPAVRQSGNS